MDQDTVATVTVTVNDRAWTPVPSLRNARPDEAVFELNPRSGRVTFGDDVHGRKPEIGATVSISFRHGAGSSGNIAKRIDDEDDLNKFWVVVRPNRQAVGWGREFSPRVP